MTNLDGAVHDQDWSDWCVRQRMPGGRALVWVGMPTGMQHASGSAELHGSIRGVTIHHIDRRGPAEQAASLPGNAVRRGRSHDNVRPRDEVQLQSSQGRFRDPCSAGRRVDGQTGFEHASQTLTDDRTNPARADSALVDAVGRRQSHIQQKLTRGTVE